MSANLSADKKHNQALNPREGWSSSASKDADMEVWEKGQVQTWLSCGNS